MSWPRWLVGAVCATLLGVGLGSPVARAGSGAALPPAVEKAFAQAPRAQVWVYLNAKADLSGAERLTRRLDKGRYVVQALQQTASQSQAALAGELTRRGVAYRSFFIVNALLVNADRPLAEWLASRPEVSRLAANPRIQMLPPMQYLAELQQPNGVEWNLEAIDVPEVWGAGYTGQGVVIGSHDTGVDWSHPALTSHYRGLQAGGVVDHNGSWFDAIKQGLEPYDDNSHGTFTTGQMVGDDGQGNQIGVAPGARWIACKNMTGGGVGSPQAYTACFQWFLAPTDVTGLNPDPALAPDIINNSWSCPVSEGCDATSLRDIVEAVQASGIFLVFSAGNTGSACGSVNEPPSMYPEVFSVGATDATGSIAAYSARGPSAYDRSLKPNVVAPGSAVRSSMPGGSYLALSGTSMASPEVAGVAALLISARLSLSGDLDRMANLLEASATRKLAPRCGGDATTRVNNTYGYGILNAKAALDLLLANSP